MNNKGLLRLIRLGFFIITCALFYYQIVKGDFYLKKAKNNYIKIITRKAIRGSILDRNGIVLAKDLPVFNISVLPYQMKKEKFSLFEELSNFLNVDKKILISSYKKHFLNYFSPVEILTDVDKEKAFKIKERFRERVIISVSPQRFYLYPYIFSHLLGYVKEAKVIYKDVKKYGYSPWERVGVRGIEKYYDGYLKGKDGIELVEVDSKGEVVGFLGSKEIERGKDIYLTVDSRFQQIAYSALKGKRGAIIVMNPYSGEIITLVSYPSFDLNEMVKGNVGGILRNKQYPLLNRALQARYPPGSVFKPIMALAGLEEKVISPKTTFECKGKFLYGNMIFRCWDAHGKQNLIEALTHSCNTYFYNLGIKLKVERISKWAKIFGWDKITGIDLPYEKRGFVPTRLWKLRVKKRRWTGGDTLNFSIGQGYLEITPLEALVAMASFANGGYLVTPYLLKKVEDVKFPHTGKVPLPVSYKNVEIIRKGLRNVVGSSSGTAHILERLHLDIAGKTGTAQNPHGRPHGWFVGFFPYQKPKYAICVFLENGGSSFQALKVAYRFLKELKENNLI